MGLSRPRSSLFQSRFADLISRNPDTGKARSQLDVGFSSLRSACGKDFGDVYTVDILTFRIAQDTHMGRA